MLKKSHISTIKAYSEEWYHARLAKFTSSKMHYLTYPTGFTDGSIHYIRERVGEELTGESADRDIETDAMRWGNLNEPGAIQRFGRQMGLEFVVVQQLITAPGSRFGSTPDALVVVRESPDKAEWEVEPVEVKCPPTYDNYISLFECETAFDVKKAKREYYWQLLDQMDQCGATTGHFVIYHPKFKAGNHRIRTFRWNDFIEEKGKKIFYIKDDIKLLRDRKQLALAKFDEIRAKLMKIPSI